MKTAAVPGSTNASDLLLQAGLKAHQARDLKTAAAYYQKILAAEPRHAEALHLLGTLAYQLRRFPDAEKLIRQAIEIDPAKAGYWGNLAATLQHQRKYAEAERAVRAALAIDPRYAKASARLGAILKDQGELEQALEAYLGALELAPKDGEILAALATTYMGLGALDEAEASCRRAIANRADDADAHWNLGLVRHLKGDLQGGWQGYAWRWKRPSSAARWRNFPYPVWQGEPLAGKSILIWGEQGVGDELMFGTLYGEILAQAAQLGIECERRLAPLFRRSFPTAMITAREPQPAPTLLQGFDYHFPAGDLARHLRRSPADFPARPGYLKADRARAQALRAGYLSQFGKGKLIGIAWRSGNAEWGRVRSAGLKDWQPLLQMPGLRFVNLQYGNVAQDIGALGGELADRIHCDPSIDQLADLDAFAAQIAALDMVVSIDNTTVHVAGALGRPTLALLPYAPDWRWTARGERTRWYGSVRLLRQRTRDDWSTVMAEAAGQVAAFRTQGHFQ